ncbi:MAG: biotin carboxylase N-terminal domain-containing protein [Bdellovibrionia bacterium]
MKLTKRQPVLIANRGEIAIRIARTCRALGFPTVAIYSEADRFAEHVRYCDSAIYVGAAAPKESYLNIERVLSAAKVSGAKYVHPGYGFLSERANFVEACEAAGLIFVGPSAQNMRQMGDKIQARATVDQLGVPRVPGSAGAVKDGEEAKKFAAKTGYPILLKAAAGGGGKGMRRVDSESDIQSAFDGASREALGAFGDGSMYVEKLILEPHHVEVQVFGDGQGGAIHLGERECSIQRRHQKVLEESPSPILNRFPKTREAMYESALRISKHIRYAGAGTFEFIVDGKGNYYFLEMNTRLQVEHPVTEWVTGVDLVSWQLLLAAGEFKLPPIPERRGCSIEVRLYAEDPQTFLPAPGKLGLIELPSGAFVRSDTAFIEPGEVSLNYDPMISKISVWGNNRPEALQRLRVALDETRVEPPKRLDKTVMGSLKTNLSFLKRLVRNSVVESGDTTTDLIGNNSDLTKSASSEPSLEAALAVALNQILSDTQGVGESSGPPSSNWNQIARREGVRL